MARPPNIRPTVRWEMKLAEDVAAQVSLLLWDASQGRIPYGAVGQFTEKLYRERLEGTWLDLAPFVGSEVGAWVVHGSRDAIEALRRKLEGAET